MEFNYIRKEVAMTILEGLKINQILQILSLGILIN